MEVVAGGTSVVDTTIVSLLLLPLTLSPSGVTTTGGPSGAATLPMVVVELQEDQPLSVVATSTFPRVVLYVPLAPGEGRGPWGRPPYIIKS